MVTKTCRGGGLQHELVWRQPDAKDTLPRQILGYITGKPQYCTAIDPGLFGVLTDCRATRIRHLGSFAVASWMWGSSLDFAFTAATIAWQPRRDRTKG